MQLKTEEEIKAYFQGKADGMRAYAWWKEESSMWAQQAAHLPWHK